MGCFRIMLPCLVLLLAACGRRDAGVRVYVEVGGPVSAPQPAPTQTGAPDLAAAMAAQGAPPALIWTTPAGWKESPGGGFRVVSFDAGGVDCAVIAFPAAMGGTEQKIAMWLSQLNAAPPPPEKMVAFVAAPEAFEAGGFTWNLYDLAPLLPADAPATIVAAVATIDDRQVAVRMKGAPADVKARREAFLALCKSIGRKPGA